MKNNEITTREKLKKYFETGKYPTESQFAELIDSLKLKNDGLTSKELLIIANNLATIDHPHISYFGNDIGKIKLPVIVSQQNAADQLIQIENTNAAEKIQYFLGDAPYSIKAKEFPTEKLDEFVYYILSYKVDPFYTITKLFGNNLPTIPDGFEFGTLQGNQFYIQVYRFYFGKQVDIVHTNVTFINNTRLMIKYRFEGRYWGDRYRDKDTVTDHYNFNAAGNDDDLVLYYNSDLSQANESVECRLYDADRGTLLLSSYLNAGNQYLNLWAGQISGVNNVRIECDYYQNVD